MNTFLIFYLLIGLLVATIIRIYGGRDTLGGFLILLIIWPLFIMFLLAIILDKIMNVEI